MDASVAVAWCFDGEQTPYTESILNLLAGDEEAAVPAHWPVEVANALLVAERRNRLTVAQAASFLRKLRGFRIRENALVAHIFDHLMPTAREWHLTIYDAAYLDLALREGLPRATLDEALRQAAVAAGVRLAGTL